MKPGGVDLDSFLAMPEGEMYDSCSELREKCSGNRISLCAIINIRSGRCSMDCRFCAQSAHYTAGQSFRPLLSEEKLLSRIRLLGDLPLSNIGLVASGPELSGSDFDRLLGYLEKVPADMRKRLCVSFGRLKRESLRALRECGIRRCHHNLETSESYYPRICSTQDWLERRATVLRAMEEDFEVCCGGLFGLGESWEDRLGLADSLAELNVAHVPVNFLIAQKGTPMENRMPLCPQEALRILCLFRMRLPNAIIRVCGGRKQILGARQVEVFRAGANAIITGDYLTSPGEDMDADLRSLAAAGLVPA